MAGLQQYNFFPTDLFYPRPPQPLESASPKSPSLPLPLPHTQDLQRQNQQPSNLAKFPSKSALVHNRRTQSPSGFAEKQSQFSAIPRSLVAALHEDDASHHF